MLLSRLYPLPDEGFFSYAIRMAKENRYENLSVFYRDLKLKYDKRMTNPNIIKLDGNHLDGMLCQLGPHVVSMSNFMYQTNLTSINSYNVEVYGKTFQQHQIIKNNPKFCPSCMLDKCYIRNIWQLKTISTCHVHGCMLVDICPCCSKRFKWNENLLEGCDNCHASWSQIACKGLIQVTKDESLLTRLLCSKIGLLEVPGDIQFSESVCELDFESIINLISLIAWTIPGSQTFRQMIHVDQKENQMTHDLLLKAVNVFKDWPKKFNDHLLSLYDEVKTYSIGTERTVNSRIKTTVFERKLFGEFYKKIYKNFSSSQFYFVREAFEHFLCHNWDLVYGKGFRKFDMEMLPFYTTTTLQRKYAISGNRLRSYVEGGYLKAVEVTFKNKKVMLIQKESVRALMEVYSKSVSMEEARNILGIHRNSLLINLHYAGCIKAVRGPKIDGFGYWRFDAGSINNTLECFETSMIKKEVSNQKMVNFKKTSTNINGYHPTYSEVITKVQNGELKPCGKSIHLKGLNQYYFDRKDLRDAFCQEIESVNQFEVSLRKAAQILKMDSKDLSFLLDEGYLTFNVKHKRFKFIKLDDLMNFKKEYVCLGEIIRETNANNNRLLKLLVTNGYNSITGKKEEERHIYLFKRSKELEDFINSHFG
ncbi:hypothetical protein D7Z26_06365 [Cohnella endophytica]|uniref:TniQ domain-containing protein n=1 Tax=Cohnella endophytica TaxID=2419778 RepID=A0A494Y0H1_9BACL|nr:TniQ family protein [Cohnella endophytica]RKP56256.1 hypothetical protein D7Z26_06365 [Cohnella endophytica]